MTDTKFVEKLESATFRQPIQRALPTTRKAHNKTRKELGTEKGGLNLGDLGRWLVGLEAYAGISILFFSHQIYSLRFNTVDKIQGAS